MAKLKLGAIADDKATKVTVELPARIGGDAVRQHGARRAGADDHVIICAEILELALKGRGAARDSADANVFLVMITPPRVSLLLS